MRVLSCLLISLLVAAESSGQTFTQQIVQRLRRPLFATSPPRDTDRLFVVGQGSGDTANVRILDLHTNEVLAEPFVTLTGLTTAGERGLLGMAFHPDYADNGKFYLYASKPGGSLHHRSHLLEYTVAGDPRTSNLADPASVRTILTFDQPFGNHNGGWIGFDPTARNEAKSYLYIGTGDGGDGGDPRNNAQDITNNWLGKILRVDIDGDDFASDQLNYAVPPSNPFVNGEGDDEIWAYGLRNPWRMAFDPENGDLWIGDVGQADREEISLLPAGTGGGQNFGWRVMEGGVCFDDGQLDGNPPCNDPSIVPPIYDYGRGRGEFEGSSVTGGHVYRGPVKEFQGHYFFADFVSANIWTIDPYASTIVPTRQNDALVADFGRPTQIASFAEDANAELYIVSVGGTLHRVASTSRDSIWVGTDATSGAAGDGVTWESANNWVRDGVPDQGFTPGDHFVIESSDNETLLVPPETLRASAVTFSSDATFRGDAEITSGNLTVAESVTATVDGALTPATQGNSIRKLGPGHLELRATNDSRVPHYVLLDGTTTLINSPAETPEQAGVSPVEVSVRGGQLVQDRQELVPTITNLTVAEDGVVVLFPVAVSSVADAQDNVLLDVDSGHLGGTLDIRLPDEFGFPATAGDQTWLPLIHFRHQPTGEFDSVVVGDASLGHQGDGAFLTIDHETFTGTGALSLVAYQAIPGDANGDRQVDFADFLIVSDNFAQPGDWLSGNFDADGFVQFSDFLAVSANFGVNLIPAMSSPVPEPSSGALLLALALCALTKSYSRD